MLLSTFQKEIVSGLLALFFGIIYVPLGIGIGTMLIMAFIADESREIKNAMRMRTHKREP